jgi:phosphonate transport system substrate-binding protein
MFRCLYRFITQKKKEVNLLVAPVIGGKTYYQAYIISKKDSTIHLFKDLKNKSFAFTDPLSNTGYIYPKKLLKELGSNKDLFFSKVSYTYGHDVSIHMVNRGVIDGASIHGLIYNFIAENHPESVSNTQIIKKSEWFGMPPVVASNHLDKKRIDLYKDLFSNIHRDSIGRNILKQLKIEKFVLIQDSIYDNVRKIKKYVETKND